MYNKLTYTLSILILLCTFSSLHAQSIIVTGAVYGPEQEPLELANVIAYSLRDSSVSTFAITDYDGKYKLEVQKDSSYLLKVIYLGYEDYTEVFEVKGEVAFKTMVMKSAYQTLGEVTVVYEVPVTVKGDTISFKADAFTTGNEKKLKDVFEKLPGFNVDENGSVKVNGKKVDKITIDGKEFFSGDTKLANNNIPADVVDKVNVLRNHTDVAQMKTLNDHDGLAIDIRLKEDKQNIAFGSVEAGGGIDKRYLGHANVFYFNPKGSINFIGNANNISEQVFTFNDIMRFNGGIVGMSSKSGANSRLSSEELGLMPLKDNKAKNTEAKVAALNFTYSPNKKWSFSGFGVFTSLGADLLNNADRTYVGLLNSNASTEHLSTSTAQNSTSGIFKLQSKYVPNNALHVEHHLLMKKSELNENQLLYTESEIANRSFDSEDLTTVPSFTQSLNLYYTLGPKHLITLEGSQLLNAKNSTFQLDTEEPIYAGIIPEIEEDNISLIQNQKLRTHKIDGSSTYYYLINKMNHLGFTAGATFTDQTLNTGLSYRAASGAAIEFDQDDLKNNLNYQFRDVYAGLHYKSKIGKFIFKPGLYAHSFQLSNGQQGSHQRFVKQMILPTLNIDYAIKKSTNLKLDYKIQTEFYDAPKFATGKILRSYNDLFSGNATLTNTWYHNAQLNYYSLNLYSFTNIYGVLSYQRKYDNLNYRVAYEDLNRISSAVNIATPNDLLTLYLAIDKRFKKFKTELNTSINYGQFINVLADESEVLNESFSQSYTASIETTMDKFPVVEIGVTARINEYNSEALARQIYHTYRPFANIEIPFLKHFILVADYEYNWYQNKNSNTQSSYDLLNAELYFKKKDSRFEFKLTGLNLLNTTAIRQDAFSEVLISTNAYFIQKRYFLGTVKYEF